MTVNEDPACALLGVYHQSRAALVVGTCSADRVKEEGDTAAANESGCGGAAEDEDGGGA